MNVTCSACGDIFAARSPRAKYCSDRCRKRVQRGGEVVALPAAPLHDSTTLGAVAKQTFRVLAEAGRLESPMGAAAMALAVRLDTSTTDTGSSLAAVVRQLDATLTSALRGAGKASGPQMLADELAQRRQRHA